MSEAIDISKCDKPALLAALFNGAAPLGLGWRQANPESMSREDAAKLLEEQTYFDYVQGRPLKVELGKDTMETWLYDRDQGEGNAARCVAAVLEAANEAE